MLKQAKITRLKSEKDKFLTNAKVEIASPSTPVSRKNRLNETFLFVSKRIQRVENSHKDWGDAKVGRRAVRVVHRRDTTRVCVVIAADHHAEASDNK